MTRPSSPARCQGVFASVKPGKALRPISTKHRRADPIRRCREALRLVLSMRLLSEFQVSRCKKLNSDHERKLVKPSGRDHLRTGHAMH
jgi:hypothetical protein